MTTTAQQIAEQFDNDGLALETSDGHSLACTCVDMGGEKTVRGSDVRYSFSDGSAIIVVGRAWDIRHPRCTCGWCWEARPTVNPPCVVAGRQ